VLSKWIGESQRNLAAIFERATAIEAVLLVDEADSLLVQRGQEFSHPHDDGVTNALLQMLERHRGVVLFATNMPDRLDGALSRRLSYRLLFPLPGPVERAAIWGCLLPPSVPTAGDIDCEALGQRFVLTGGLIKNAVLKAAFRCSRQGGRLSQALLEAAACEEFDAQTGGLEHRQRVVGFSR
jgi:SpoVK/Ycf46/Vps4 family AAA+-type ATPase